MAAPDPLTMLKMQVTAIKAQVAALEATINSLDDGAPELPSVEDSNSPATFGRTRDDRSDT